jgi:dTDP-4-dehydrorhamnose reductase
MNKSIKIIFTGGSGRFGKIFRSLKYKHKIYFPTKKQFNVLKISKMKKYLKNKKPKYLIHAAGLSRPMSIHNNNINKSIDSNIIGTANVTKICSENNIKLIYLSTAYVYPGTKGNYREISPLKPINNYAWSKLGGESAVQMYKNSLILRLSMTEKPFVHNQAFVDFKTNFMFHIDFAKILLKLINQKGIINVGGPSQTVYSFAKKINSKVKKISIKKILGKNTPINVSMNLERLKKILSNH